MGNRSKFLAISEARARGFFLIIMAVLMLSSLAFKVSALSVVSGSISFPSKTDRDALKITASIGPIVVDEDIQVIVGDFSQTIPFAAFVQKKQKITFKGNKKTPGISKLTFDTKKNIVKITAGRLDLTGLSNPLNVRIRTVSGDFNECSRPQFQEKSAKKWIFKAKVHVQSECLNDDTGVIPGAAALTVIGRVIFDNGMPVVGAELSASTVSQQATQALRQQQQHYAQASDWTHPDFKIKSKSQANTAAVLKPSHLEQLATNATITNESGKFSLAFDSVSAFPVRVLTKVSYQQDMLPKVDNTRWATANAKILDLGTIIIPLPQISEIPISDGMGERADSAVKFEDLPTGVDRIFAKSFDPDTDADAFPGEFTENGRFPINSSLLLWVEALDAEGDAVDELNQAVTTSNTLQESAQIIIRTLPSGVTIRARIPRSQWLDLIDIQPGTDRIEIPIYEYDESIDMWVQAAVPGWLEDSSGTILPEDAQAPILDGGFLSDIFATFTTDHFSWFSVDYAFVGPWGLATLDADKRNNDCLYDALQLSNAIIKSAAGHAAYARVNLPDINLDDELSDGNGPSLNNQTTTDWGSYSGDAGGSENQFVMANRIWGNCAAGATVEQKKNTTLRMAVNILHETAHWKDDVKKFAANFAGLEPMPRDTLAEEGTQLERDIFGGDIDQDAAGNPTMDGNLVSNAARDAWLDLANWPPAPDDFPAAPEIPMVPSALEVSIALAADTFDLAMEIPVEVTYRNISEAPIQVMNKAELEGYPLYFNIVNQMTGDRIGFLGPEVELQVLDSDFTTLQPDETLVLTVNLVRNPNAMDLHYQLINSGTYNLTAVYEPFRGVSEATSNTVAFTLNPGGSITGLVTRAADATPIEGVLITVLQAGNVIAMANTDASGNYSFPELPAGTFTLRASRSGFLNSIQDDIIVVLGENTIVNFSLARLLAFGELQIVLIWGETPTDLDSHLWLPLEMPYHIAFFEQGNKDDCPFAELDVDDVTSFGPETVTISQRVASGIYRYAIHNFSLTPAMTQSGARVQVFDASGLVVTYDIPTEGEGVWWNVFEMDSATGAITEINSIGADPAPYANTTSGCVL